MQILGITDNLPGTPAAHTVPDPNREVSATGSRVLAMANDANCLVLMDQGSLQRIKDILENFGILSGLLCNIEKTVLIPVGHIAPVPDQILNMGFEIKDSATILGMEINNINTNFNSSAQKIAEKIKKEANWWARFNLSLPGRINVTKSMLYLQLNYLGGFLPFTPEQILLFSEQIETFVRGNLNISKNRIYTEVKNGGLGLCNIRDFLDTQKCGWLTLAKNNNEKWKEILLTKCLGNIHRAIIDDFQIQI